MNGAQALQAVLVIGVGLLALGALRVAVRAIIPPRRQPGALAKTVDALPRDEPRDRWGIGGLP